MKYIDKLLDSFSWTSSWREIPSRQTQSRIEDDSIEGRICVTFTEDGDAWVAVVPDPHELKRTLRFREASTGGGKSERVRKALMILALAIKADNEEI